MRKSGKGNAGGDTMAEKAVFLFCCQNWKWSNGWSILGQRRRSQVEVCVTQLICGKAVPWHVFKFSRLGEQGNGAEIVCWLADGQPHCIVGVQMKIRVIVSPAAAQLSPALSSSAVGYRCTTVPPSPSCDGCIQSCPQSVWFSRGRTVTIL